MSEQSFKPQDVKRARFLLEFIEESEQIMKNLQIPKKTLELEKLTFLRGLLNNPRCSRKRREETDGKINEAKKELDTLKDRSRTINNELEIFKRTYSSLPERLRNLAEKTPLQS